MNIDDGPPSVYRTLARMAFSIQLYSPFPSPSLLTSAASATIHSPHLEIIDRAKSRPKCKDLIAGAQRDGYSFFFRLPRSLGASRRLRASSGSPMTWNAGACRDTTANGGIVHGREGENEDAAAAVAGEQAAARGAREVRAPLRPRSSRGEPVAAADVASYWDACPMLGSWLIQNK